MKVYVKRMEFSWDKAYSILQTVVLFEDVDDTVL